MVMVAAAGGMSGKVTVPRTHETQATVLPQGA